jgi:hypothetical protein
MIVYGIPYPIWEAVGFGLKVLFIAIALAFLVVDLDGRYKAKKENDERED